MMKTIKVLGILIHQGETSVIKEKRCENFQQAALYVDFNNEERMIWVLIPTT